MLRPVQPGAGTAAPPSHPGHTRSSAQSTRRHDPAEAAVVVLRGAVGVTTLELDVQITQDGHAVVTHDRRVSATKCRDTRTYREPRHRDCIAEPAAEQRA